MSVLIEQSICKDCLKVNTCQRLKRLIPGTTIRDSHTDLYGAYGEHGGNFGVISGAKLYAKPNRPKEIFELIIVNCSLKS